MSNDTSCQTIIELHYENCDECPHYRKYTDSKKAYETCKDCPNNTSHTKEMEK